MNRTGFTPALTGFTVIFRPAELRRTFLRNDGAFP